MAVNTETMDSSYMVHIKSKDVKQINISSINGHNIIKAIQEIAQKIKLITNK